MTGRERVLKAYRHEEPDKTPIGEMYDIAPPTREVVLGRACGFAERMEMLRDAEWDTIVEMEARNIIDIAVKLGFDMIGVRRNISPNFERPSPISEYKWEIGETIHEYLPESGITRTYRNPEPSRKQNSEKDIPAEEAKNAPIVP
ncbi:MAG: hypothetical protein H8D67_03320, partial [Deltaproteobacteria bacterium]|nr:hypothetical protein [Deltaproteobacteria bacterium]